MPMQTIPGAAPVPGAAGYVQYIDQLRLAIAQLQAAIGNDEAFATTITGLLGDKVGKSGAETISGTKTFSAPPVVPTATADGQAVNRGQVTQMMGTFVRVIKTADESLSSGNSSTPTVVQADDHLTYAIPAGWVGRRVRGEFGLWIGGDQAGDFKSRIDLPANSYLKGYAAGLTSTATAGSGNQIRQGFLFDTGATSTAEYQHGALTNDPPVVFVEWVLDFVPTAAGNLTLLWSQVNSSATPTIVHMGSELTLLAEPAA